MGPRSSAGKPTVARQTKLRVLVAEDVLRVDVGFALVFVDLVGETLGERPSILTQPWPKWDESWIAEDKIEVVIQINGKLRDRIAVPASISETEARQMAAERERVKPHLEGKEVVKEIYVPGRLVNFVLK